MQRRARSRTPWNLYDGASVRIDFFFDSNNSFRRRILSLLTRVKSNTDNIYIFLR